MKSRLLLPLIRLKWMEWKMKIQKLLQRPSLKSEESERENEEVTRQTSQLILILT